MTHESGKPSGMTLVDAYMVPDEDVDEYIADRERLAALAIKILTPSCALVERCWQGSEDGEAVVGFNAEGEILSMIHLDPDGIELLGKPEALRAYLRVRGEAP